MISNPQETGRQLIRLLSQIPGVAVASNEKIREQLGELNARTLTNSSEALDAVLYEGISVGISYPDEPNNTTAITFRRRVGKDILGVKIVVDNKGNIRRGSVSLAEHDTGQFSIDRGSIGFDEKGRIEQRSNKPMIAASAEISQLNVPSLLSQVTSTDSFEPIIMRTVLSTANIGANIGASPR